MRCVILGSMETGWVRCGCGPGTAEQQQRAVSEVLRVRELSHTVAQSELEQWLAHRRAGSTNKASQIHNIVVAYEAL